MAINTLTMKVYDYNEENDSLIVAFKSDASIKSIDEYPRIAYQPSMFDTPDPETIIKNIAVSGISVAVSQDKKDAIQRDENAINFYKSKIGQEFQYGINELIPPPGDTNV